MEEKGYFYVDSPLYRLECTAKACARYYVLFFKKHCSHFGLTQNEYAVMDTIVRSPEISQIELARLLYKGRSHITQILNALEKNDLIMRTDELKNGRKIRKTILTDKGTETYSKIKSIAREKFSHMTEYFEVREKEFFEMLDEIQNILTEGETVRFD